ncbi:hypothetical protein GH714_043191 [Hevea brasiliensis]|uniref:RING-type E3 ubiquitin transferase n=1 Tax=Hevea brasiliensis TaxID=3981 RepID=A0A6A6K1E2_HEVBR|nr:hypothetical protein GH714_043191 [Hevea brasiliensis]
MLATNPSVSSPTSDSVDTSPLLTRSIADHLLRSRRLLRRPPQPLRGAAARLLRRASSRRMMLREPSFRVRENAAQQLEERQSDWAYSRPIIVLDVLWNLAFVVIAAVVLGLSVKEEPEVPLRLWIIGYGLQCVFHIACVIFEYRRRLSGRNMGLRVSRDSTSGSGVMEEILWTIVLNSEPMMMKIDCVVVSRGKLDVAQMLVVKHLESANTMFSFIWWIVGFYWVTAGGQNVTHDSPQLYWLCITFLAFDVIFVFICVALLVSLEGATKEEIDQLPKYKFHKKGDFEKVNGEIQASFGGTMIECEIDMPTEPLLSHEMLSAAFAFLHMKMELSYVNFLVITISTAHA